MKTRTLPFPARTDRIQLRPRLGGLINEYRQPASNTRSIAMAEFSTNTGVLHEYPHAA